MNNNHTNSMDSEGKEKCFVAGLGVRGVGVT